MSKYLVPNKFNGYGADGSRNYYFGGGGGGGQSQREATAEEKRLWAAQAGALEGMTQLSMPMLQTGMSNLGLMANQSMDGTLAAQLRNQAGADANVALGSTLNDMKRVGGFDPTLHGGQDAMAQWGLGAAKQRIGAMNQASMAAEDQKWQRNAALTGLASGQGNSAVQGMGSLAGQIGANRQAAMNADSQSMQGLGMMGAYMGNKMFADGGEVHAANGGYQMYRPASFSYSPWEISGASGYKGPSTLDQVGAVATPMAMMFGAKEAKNLLGPSIRAGYENVKNAIGNQVNGLMSAPPSESMGLIPGSEQSTMLAAQDAAFLPESMAGNLTAETAAAATGTEAAGAAGAGALSTIGTVLPWVGGAILLSQLFNDDDYASGGLAKRKDLRPGGKVKGPGTETSDSIPAKLSDGEYVLNAEAVKMVGKDKLEALNNAGLQKREQRKAKGGMVKLPKQTDIRGSGSKFQVHSAYKLASGGLMKKGAK